MVTSKLDPHLHHGLTLISFPKQSSAGDRILVWSMDVEKPKLGDLIVSLGIPRKVSVI
jgi:hypothetical protein